ARGAVPVARGVRPRVPGPVHVYRNSSRAAGSDAVVLSGVAADPTALLDADAADPRGPSTAHGSAPWVAPAREVSWRTGSAVPAKGVLARSVHRPSPATRKWFSAGWTGMPHRICGHPATGSPVR